MRCCRTCGSPRISQILRFDSLPLAGSFLAHAGQAASEVFLPITVMFCEECSLVQLAEVVDPDLLFRQYCFSTSTIPSLVRHFSDYADFIQSELKASVVVEFGCNDGALLTEVKKRGLTGFGIDASENISGMARDKGLEVINGYFTPETARQVVERVGKADVVTGSNCFAHNRDPGPILDGARLCLKDDGLFIVEVMYAGDLLSTLQWDTLYHEHLAIFSLTSAKALLERHGYTVVDVLHLPMHGGSLRVMASPKAGARPHRRVSDMLAAERRAGIDSLAAWQSFGERVRRQIAIVGRTVEAVAGKYTWWAYGASGRATMWLNAAGLRGVAKVVDESPLRIGRLMPGLHQPIVPPEELRRDQPDYLLVTAWNYYDSIRAKTDWYKGTWAVPCPALRFD